MTESLLNGTAFALLLTSLWILRFRGWNRPGAALAYFAFFFVVEVGATRFLLPPGVFGSGFAILCIALSVPVLAAAFFIRRHERQERTADRDAG